MKRIQHNRFHFHLTGQFLRGSSCLKMESDLKRNYQIWLRNLDHLNFLAFQKVNSEAPDMDDEVFDVPE